jgi:hypothetical protein
MNIGDKAVEGLYKRCAHLLLCYGKTAHIANSVPCHAHVVLGRSRRTTYTARSITRVCIGMLHAASNATGITGIIAIVRKVMR